MRQKYHTEKFACSTKRFPMPKLGWNRKNEANFLVCLIDQMGGYRAIFTGRGLSSPEETFVSLAEVNSNHLRGTVLYYNLTNKCIQ